MTHVTPHHSRGEACLARRATFRLAHSRAAALLPGNLDTEPLCVSKRVFRKPCSARLLPPNRDRQGADVFNRADVFHGPDIFRRAFTRRCALPRLKLRCVSSSLLQLPQRSRTN